MSELGELGELYVLSVARYMNLGSYRVERGTRNDVFGGLIKHYETLIANDGPNSEAFYWLGVAAKDYECDEKKALNYFIYSARF